MLSTVPKRLVTADELSLYLGLPKPTIYTWASLRRFPSGVVVHLGRALRFDLQAVDAWIASQKAEQG